MEVRLALRNPDKKGRKKLQYTWRILEKKNWSKKAFKGSVSRENVMFYHEPWYVAFLNKVIQVYLSLFILILAFNNI